MKIGDIMARNVKRNVVLTEEEKEFRQLVCDNKGDIIESEEYFDIGVNGLVLKAKIVGAGKKAIKFCFNIGGISTKSKATPSEFFLDYNEVDDNLIKQIQEFVGEVEEEEVDDAVITMFGQQPLPAK